MLKKKKEVIFKQVWGFFQGKLHKVNATEQKSHQSRLILKPDSLGSLLAAVQSHVSSAVTHGYKIGEWNEMESKPVQSCNSHRQDT